MRKAALALLPLVLTACSSPPHHRFAVLHHPETKQTVRCEVDPRTTWQWEYKRDLQNCVEAYEKVGFERVDTRS